MDQGEDIEIKERLSAMEIEEEENNRVLINFNEDSFVDEGKPITEEQWEFLKAVKDRLWNGQLLLAEEMVDEGRERSLIYAVVYAEIGFWRFNFDQSDENLELLIQRIELVDNMSRILSKKYKPDKGGLFKAAKVVNVEEDIQLSLYCEICIASGIVQLTYSISHLKKQNYVKGAMYLHRGWKKFLSCMSLIKTMESKGYQIPIRTYGIVKFFIGAFNFGASMIPPNFKFIGTILGLKGNRESAREDISFCIDTDTSLTIEATLVEISLKQFFFDKEEEALIMLNDLMEKYPESPAMWYLHGLLLKTLGEVNNSILSFSKSIEYRNDMENLKVTNSYQLGHSFFLKNNFPKAIEFLEYFLDNSTIPNFKPYAAYLLGFSYWMTDQRDKIEAYYSCVAQWVRPNESYDEYALKQVQQFEQTGSFTDFDLIFTPADALFVGHFFKKALKKLEEIIPILKENKNNRDYYAKYYYLKGAILRGLKKNDRSEDMLNRALVNPNQLSTNSLYVATSALCELAELSIESNDLPAAEKLLRKAKSYSNYDWERIVGWRIGSLQQKISLRKKS